MCPPLLYVSLGIIVRGMVISLRLSDRREETADNNIFKTLEEEEGGCEHTTSCASAFSATLRMRRVARKVETNGKK
jgi:hypothetical protein